MNKAELVKAIAAESGLTQKDSELALNAMVSAVTKALKNGDKVSLVGFGAFSVVEKAERKGVNPATKAEIVIPAKKAVKFKAGAGLEF